MSIGEQIIVDLLKEKHDRYILLDPSGWVSDASFVDNCAECGIKILSPGELKESSLFEVSNVASNKKNHETIVLLAKSHADADSWHRHLGSDWHMKDVQPSTILPGLDPEVSKHLSPSQAANLQQRISADSAALSPTKSAEVILSELFGLKTKRMTELDYFLDAALELHIRGDKPNKVWLQCVSRYLPSIQGCGISFLDALTSIEAFAGIVDALIQLGAISQDAGKSRLQQLTFGASISERLGLDLNTIKNQIKNVYWEDVPLASWPEKSETLGKLSLAEELFEDRELRALRETTEEAFSKSLIKDYFKLQQNPNYYRPPMVHKILPFIQAHHKEDKVALIIIDCLPITFWLVIRWVLENRFSLELASEDFTFAWIPTLTSVSRQSICSARIPADLGGFIKGTSREQGLWEEFWLDKGFCKDAIQFIKVAETKENVVTEIIEDQDVRRFALIYNDIDKLVHSSTSISTLNTELILMIVDKWVSDFLGQIIKNMLSFGWVIFLTSDHGARRMRCNVGNMREGVVTEKTGHRVRIYSRQNFAEESKVEGTLWDARGTLPPDYVALLAPNDAGYGAPFGWGHGGASWEEVIVPFVRFGGTR